MKILYAIQGTGNGHITRAKEVIPYLKKYGELDLLISGSESELSLPCTVKYSFKGLSFVFGKKGGIDLWNTYLKNHVRSVLKEVNDLPIEDYDLIINDFEPISAWACQLHNKPCVALSNQCALTFVGVKKPKSDDIVGKAIIHHYAPSTSAYGFCFQPEEPLLFTPIIRQEIRDLKTTNGGHYVVYLPSYGRKRIIKVLSQLKDTRWHVFSKTVEKEETIENIWFRPVNEGDFLESIRTCAGVISAAGFGTTSETLFLGKKLLVIPQKHQYEQHCNGFSLKQLGVPVIKSLKKKHLPKIEEWLKSDEIIQVNFPNQTKELVETILHNEFFNKDYYLDYLTNQQFLTTT